MNSNNGVWLSITDYSGYKNVSVSTIRRHIKNNILKHKEENGKYFIYVPSVEKRKLREEEETLRIKLELELMRSQIRQLNDENAALKMLIDIYENRSSNELTTKDLPPELPLTI
jgi:cell shape-determining protein MreC